MLYKRLLNIPQSAARSFFLWGPRQAGKTKLLQSTFPHAYRVDLLNTDRLIELTNSPSLLREELVAMKKKPDLVIIDEIQKVPQLLDEVHWLIENHKIRFGLCGSSARKLKNQQANLLGGRALRYELYTFSAKELGKDFNFDKAFKHGLLPAIYLDDDPNQLLRSYVTDYLKEEIANEGLTRSLPSFSRFLEVAGISDTQILNYSKIAQDCQVSPPTVKGFYEILVDTLLGCYLEAYTKKAKRKIISSPKFYLFDIGVSNYLARRQNVVFGSELSGLTFESWLHNELKIYNSYSQKYEKLSFWRLADHNATEVDFVVGDMQVAIECKASSRIVGHQLKALYEIKREHKNLKRLIVVCNEPRRRIIENQIEIIPALEFIDELWAGDIF